MGRTSRYHPVSMTVIRGAAIYHGFKFGPIRQLHVDEIGGFARYTAVLEYVPNEIRKKSLNVIHKALQNCFMDDIRVSWVTPRKGGGWNVTINVDVRQTTL